MHNFPMLIVSKDTKLIETMKKSLSFKEDITDTSYLDEVISLLKKNCCKMLILDEDIEYNSNFIIFLKNIDKNIFVVGIVRNMSVNIFVQIKEVQIFTYLLKPISERDIHGMFERIEQAESRREELRKTGMYDYLTDPVTKGNVDSVISIVYDYMTKPISKETVERAASNVYQYITTPITKNDIEFMLKKVMGSIKDLHEIDESELESFLREDEILGKSEDTLELKRLIKKVSFSDATVLIMAESGAGKELVARTVFKNSSRKDKNYLVVNCAAISPSLIESELFGYEKGAFTGANYNKKGIIEEADGGTLFLDEIGDMDINSQAKLLRVLENGELKRVGGTKTIKVNVRFVAATNQSLEEYVEKGKFRRDLYYRLMCFPIYIKSLRERKEDIEVLVKYFLFKLSRKNNTSMPQVSKEAMQRLLEYDYPGNVRELKNIVERTYLMSDEKRIEVKDLPRELKVRQESSILKNKYSMQEILKAGILNIEEVEKALIITALEKTGWNRNEATKLLGIGRTTLYEKMKKYNFEEEKK